VVTVKLSDAELDLLRAGLHVWGGPVTCSEEMAVGIGFGRAFDCSVERRRMYGEL
jgi:hypothetical protein